MSITAYGSGARTVSTATQQFTSLKDTLATLQSQLSTGKIAKTYSGLGTGAITSLNLNARLSTLNGYSAAIGDAQTRVKITSSGLQSVSDMASQLATKLSGSALADIAQRGEAQTIATGDLTQVVDVLNADVNGRYLFSGRATDTEPVVSSDVMLNGDPAAGLAGVKTLVTERKAADNGGTGGTGGTGRIDSSLTGSTLTVDNNSGGVFGFEIVSTHRSSAGITASSGSGAATLDVVSQPAVGDTVSLDLRLPDGNTQTITLTAGGADAAADGVTFAVGDTTADTAKSLQISLTNALKLAASTTLASASTMRASTDFFAGSTSVAPKRVVGTPPETATQYEPDSAGKTVIWYKGDDDTTTSARDTAPVSLGDGQSVSIGLRANEPGLQTVLASFAALAVDSFSDSDPLVVTRFNALANANTKALLGTGGKVAVDNMTTDLAMGSVALGNAAQRNSATHAQVQDTLDATENADPTEIASELMATQNRLQAAYQVTASIAKLSLNDYL